MLLSIGSSSISSITTSLLVSCSLMILSTCVRFTLFSYVCSYAYELPPNNSNNCKRQGMLAFVCSPEGGEDRGYWRKPSSFILFHVFSSFQALLAPVQSGTPSDGAERRLSILFPFGIIDEDRTLLFGFCYSSSGDRLYVSQLRSEASDCIISIPRPIS